MHLCTKKIISKFELGENMNKFLQVLSVLLITSFSAKSQTGEIQGRVTDEKGEPVPYAILVVIRDQAGKERTSKGTKADANGRYTLKGMNPGTYNLMATSVGKPSAFAIGIQVYAGRPVEVDFRMALKSNVKGVVDIVAKPQAKPKKILDVFTPKDNVIGAEEVKDASVRDVNSIAASTGGVIQEDVGASLNVGGGRDNGLVVFVDGVKMTGSAGLPPNQIQQLEIYTSGVPAKYGDANAGVMSIVTKGPSDKLMGTIEGLTSKFIDPYGFKLGSFSLRGPLVRGKATYDSTNPNFPTRIKGDPILGFSIGGEFQHEDDHTPTINGTWKVKDDVYDRILNNPYRLSSDGSQMVLEQAFLAKNDLERTSSHQNLDSRTFRLNGKLDWKVIPNSTNISLGFRASDRQFKDYIQRYSLLNYQNNPIKTDKSYNVYLRLYQPLSGKNNEKNIIRNANMSFQIDATLSGEDFRSSSAGTNPWNYGYIGKFTERNVYNYTRQSGGDGTKVFYAPNQYLTFTDFVTANGYTPQEVFFNFNTGVNNPNPLAAQQTDAFVKFYNNTIGQTDKGKLRSINEIENNQGVVNGARQSVTVHDLFFPAARMYNGLQKQENLQLRASGAINFDIQSNKKNSMGVFVKHTIEAGFEIEQRINRKHSMNPLTLWTVAQSALLNNHLSPNDNQNYNPLMIMRGGTVKMRLQDYMKQDTITFAAFDTLLYDKEVSNGQMTTFSKNLRDALFNGDTLVRINIHELNPSDLKMEWFSADEILNNNFISASWQTNNNLYGYDVYGNDVSASTTFNEFFTSKDKNGNFLRHVAPFMPRYAAGYIQDRFQLGSLALNIGFRLDYFDPNSNVLIDPYVPQGARTIAMVDSINNKKAIHPSNLPSNAVVYADKAVDPTRITGYRVDKQWFDASGKELGGPQSIELASGGNINPYLIGNTAEERAKRDMSFSTFDPSLMFRKTSGRFAFSPRVNFSFAIDSNALLFAHYDVLRQRPEQDATIATALNYYSLLQRRNISVINNPDLDFSTTTDIELGFKQALTKRSSLTINFQYREFSNQVGATSLLGAYPGSYTTFANTDFSTVKSLGISFEQRRIKNLRLKANYTMQFAEGTGSSRTAQVNLINAGIGNFRVINPLDFDTRHNINFSANYRWDSDNPDNKHVSKALKDLGINLDFNLRSGTPYTQARVPVANALMTDPRFTNLGDVNSGSLPWRFNTNLKVDKDFNFKLGKLDSAKGEINKSIISLNVYLQVTNLFNSANVLRVYRYSGVASQDGYYNTPDEILDYNSKEAIAKGYGQAFRDLYNVALEIPDDRSSMFVRPRIIQLGATLSF